MNEQIMGFFLKKLVGVGEDKPLLSDEHFSVGGRLLQALATMPRSRGSMARRNNRLSHRETTRLSSNQSRQEAGKG